MLNSFVYSLKEFDKMDAAVVEIHVFLPFSVVSSSLPACAASHPVGFFNQTL